MTYTHQQNRRVTGLDLEFAGGLHQHNCGEGYWDPDWQIVRVEANGTIALQKNHLTVHADPQQHLQSDRPWNVGDRVNLKLPKNLVQGDRYIAVGNAGVPVGVQSIMSFDLEADEVNALMQSITFELNQLNLPFTLGCFYDPLDYPHPEAAILTVHVNDKVIAETIAQNQT
jgi:hypothetical protein